MFITFLDILVKIVIPIFVLFTVGFVAQKMLKMDSRTFSRMNIYIFVPAVLFTKIYNANVTMSFFWQMLIYILLIQFAMMALGEAASRILKYPREKRKAFCNSLVFFNSGNYGLPLVDLAFKGNPIALTSQVFILVIQNVMVNTFGVFQASSGKSNYKKALKNILLMPTLYVLAIVIIIKILKIHVPTPILTPITYISQAFIATATITLGVQLAEIKGSFKLNHAFMSAFIRLIISPVLGFLLIMLLGIKGILAESMIIGVSMPSAVNTAILAKEFNNEPEYATQVVFVSTILSAFTLSLVIFFVRSM